MLYFRKADFDRETLVALYHWSPGERVYRGKNGKKQNRGAKLVSLFHNLTEAEHSDYLCFLGRISSIF